MARNFAEKTTNLTEWKKKRNSKNDTITSSMIRQCFVVAAASQWRGWKAVSMTFLGRQITSQCRARTQGSLRQDTAGARAV